MLLRELLSALSGILMLAAYVPYIMAIFRGTTRPIKATWIILALLDTLTVAGMIAKDSLNGQMIGAILGSGIVALLSFRFGMPGWKRTDIVCFVLAIIGICLWWTFQDAIFGIVTGSLAFIIGTIPTFRSAWEDPQREDRTAWMLYFLSCIPAVAAVPEWTLAHATQPISFFITEGTMVYLLWIRPRRVTRAI
jgi:hypothetical protein